MKKFLLLVAATLIVGCGQKTEVVDVIKGDPGTSCSVAPEYSYEGEFQQMLGSRISCTDGSFSVVLNGAQGIQGVQGIQGIQGPQGQAGGSCQVYRPSHANYVKLYCPNQSPVKIYDGEDGEDGEDGRDGKSCSVASVYGGAKITCGSWPHATYAYIFNGQDGQDGEDGEDGEDGSNGTNGTSCTVVRESNRAKITCGSQVAYVYDGEDGDDGEDAFASLTPIQMTSSCKVIDGSNSGKLNGSSGEVKFYSSTDCSGSFDTLHDGEVAYTDNGNLVFNVVNSDTYLKLLTLN